MNKLFLAALFVFSFSTQALDCPKDTTLKVNSKGKAIQQFCVNKSGKMHGPAETKTQSGVLVSRGQYDNGEPDGEWKRYWPTDELRDIGVWDKGKPVGAWSVYDSEGSLTNYNLIRCGKAKSLYSRDTKILMSPYDSENCGLGLFRNFQFGFLHMKQSDNDYVNSVYFKIAPFQYHLFWNIYSELYIAAAPIKIGEDEMSLTTDLGAHLFVVFGRHSLKLLLGAQKWIIDGLYFKSGIEYEYLFPWLDKFSPMPFGRLRGLYFEMTDVDLPKAKAESFSLGLKFDY